MLEPYVKKELIVKLNKKKTTRSIMQSNENVQGISQARHFRQRIFFIINTCMAYLFWILVCITSAEAQAQNVINIEQVNKAWARFLLCDFSQPEDVDAASWEQTTTYINNQIKSFENQRNAPQSAHFKVNAYGTQFEQINMVYGVVAVWTPEKRSEVLEKNLAKLGLQFADENFIDFESNKPIPARLAKKIIAPVKINVYLMDKPLSSLGFNNITGGTTLVCTTESASEKEIIDTTGFPSARTLQIRLYKDGLEDTLVNQIIEKGGKDIKQVIAGSSVLNLEQVKALYSTGDFAIIDALIGNSKILLSAEQIDTILNKPVQYNRLKLISNHFMQLNSAQISKLKQSDNLHLRDVIVMKEGGQHALNTLNQYFSTSRKDEEIRWLLSYSTLDDAMVDLILNKGSNEIRQRLTLDSKYPYNKSQIERILQDTSSGVQIGLLRRKDIPITDAQIDRGLKLKDLSLTFWYKQRMTVPTPEQIEFGLTHQDIPTRRGWAFEKKFRVTQQQAIRGLEDSDSIVRGAFLKRAEVMPLSKHLDACTVDPDISLRFTCVESATYMLTQWRFERIAFDANSNVLRGYLKVHKKQAIDLEPFFLHALANAPDNVLIKIANNSAMLYTEKMLRQAKSHPSPFVSLYFKNHKSEL
jgi:hypothetical protein